MKAPLETLIALVLGTAIASGAAAREIPVDEVSQWSICGIGDVSQSGDGNVVLREGKDSKGVVLLSPWNTSSDVVLRYKIRPNQFEGILLALLSVSGADGTGLVVPKDYDGAMDFWNGARAKSANFLIGFFTNYHQPNAFLYRNPGGVSLAKAVNPAAKPQWYDIEAGRNGARVWLKIDGAKILESDAPENAGVPAGRIGFRLRGPGDGSFFCEIKNVTVLDGRENDSPQ